MKAVLADVLEDADFGIEVAVRERDFGAGGMFSEVCAWR